MERLASIFLACGVMAAFAAPTANEDFVVAEDAKTYTNAVNAARAYTDTAIAGATGGVVRVETDPTVPAWAKAENPPVSGVQ